MANGPQGIRVAFRGRFQRRAVVLRSLDREGRIWEDIVGGIVVDGSPIGSRDRYREDISRSGGDAGRHGGGDFVGIEHRVDGLRITDGAGRIASDCGRSVENQWGGSTDEARTRDGD